eukprot:1758929-Ditylum_brightwellii.AAC.1
MLTQTVDAQQELFKAMKELMVQMSPVINLEGKDKLLILHKKYLKQVIASEIQKALIKGDLTSAQQGT